VLNKFYEKSISVDEYGNTSIESDEAAMYHINDVIKPRYVITVIQNYSMSVDLITYFVTYQMQYHTL